MSAPAVRTIEVDPRFLRWALIGAQLVALIVYLLALGFLLRTNGGTLFLFSTVAPVLILIATLALAAVGLYRYHRRSSMFAFALFEPGDVIFQQGDHGDFAYFIQQGEVEVIRREQEIEIVIARLSEGHHFGETALLSNAPHHAAARAKTRVRVAMLGKTKFLHMIRFVQPMQDDFMSTINQRATEHASRRAKSAAQSVPQAALQSTEDQGFLRNFYWQK
ncbi:MAG: cyclic nucleotide-binding domain-containing protein [Candidatus Acidiferrales bacterium]